MGLLLFQDDLDQIKKIATENILVDKKYDKLYEYINKVMINRYHESDSILSTFSNLNPKWNNKDTIRYNPNFANCYPASKNQKKDNLYRWVKLNILKELEDSALLETSIDRVRLTKIVSLSISNLRNNYFENYLTKEKMSSYLEKSLLNAIAQTADPHTEYLDNEEKEDFTKLLSPTIEEYGFSFKSGINNEILIAYLKPGSPAWKSNNLNVGDIVLFVKIKNKSKTDLSKYDVLQFEELLDGSNEKEIELTIKKQSGVLINVKLKKAVQHSEQNAINSFIINQDNKIGYISLPSFYSNFSNSNELGCANDVAKEISKLKSDSVKGIIIDLRNNSGGSVDEAINLAGIFIDEGPLGYSFSKLMKPKLLKDFNRGLLYDGPLVIMQNTFSASASELFAMMLRQHNRAIIVGTNSFGKASAQIILPLDTNVSSSLQTKNYTDKDGYIKITVNKFYDLKGNTHQLNGIEPDIFIPDPYYKLPLSEKHLNYSLTKDVLEKKNNFIPSNTNPFRLDTIEANQKMKNSEYYTKTIMMSDSVKFAFNSSFYDILEPLEYKKKIDRMNGLNDRIENKLQEKNLIINMSPNSQLKQLMDVDEYVNDVVTNSIIDFKKDMVLYETFNILNINTHNNETTEKNAKK